MRCIEEDKVETPKGGGGEGGGRASMRRWYLKES